MAKTTIITDNTTPETAMAAAFAAASSATEGKGAEVKHPTAEEGSNKTVTTETSDLASRLLGAIPKKAKGEEPRPAKKKKAKAEQPASEVVKQEEQVTAEPVQEESTTSKEEAPKATPKKEVKEPSSKAPKRFVPKDEEKDFKPNRLQVHLVNEVKEVERKEGVHYIIINDLEHLHDDEYLTTFLRDALEDFEDEGELTEFTLREENRQGGRVVRVEEEMSLTCLGLKEAIQVHAVARQLRLLFKINRSRLDRVEVIVSGIDNVSRQSCNVLNGLRCAFAHFGKDTKHFSHRRARSMQTI